MAGREQPHDDLVRDAIRNQIQAADERAAREAFEHTVAIVGGGIAGLYCARLLAEGGYTVTVFETREELGGRMETRDLKGFKRGSLNVTEPLVKAEFGPMRFELEIQKRFLTLCKDLGFSDDDFVPFTPPEAPPLPIRYPLSRDEPRDTLQLFKLGVLKMFGRNPTVEDKKVVLSPADEAWLSGLRDDGPEWSYDTLRRDTELRGTKLWSIGLWQALRMVLSEVAVDQIKNHGPFYALLPENPNAAEWGIFWLRLFQLGDKPLSTMKAGVRSVWENLVADIEGRWGPNSSDPDRVRLLRRREVTGLQLRRETGLVVEFLDKRGEPKTGSFSAAHVILALPQQPVRKLSRDFPQTIRDDLEKVIAFPLLKAFLVLKRPPSWIPERPRPQEFAWLLPTREVHYLAERPVKQGEKEDPDSNGVMMIYTDRPATEYWRPYVNHPDQHDSAQVGHNPTLKAELVRLLFTVERRRAADTLLKALGAARRRIRRGGSERDDRELAPLIQLIKKVPEIPPTFWSTRFSQWLETLKSLPSWDQRALLEPAESVQQLFGFVSDYGIRDWSQEPFGAGCHAWRPGAESREVRRNLRSFGLVGRDYEQNVHICGEAYSDYQGFIEGALRSAADAVAAITKQKPPHNRI